MTATSQIDWAGCGEDATRLLSDLLQLDTSNPPGNERKAAEYLQVHFQREGIESEILEKESGRSNLLARLEGSRPGRKLMYLSHTDVVPASDPDAWQHPPFSGAVDDGYVWGRGALDMKSMTAAEAVAFTLFKRLNLDFAGELIYLAVADEEMGGRCGAKWLAEEHAHKVRADYVLNEGGGMALQLGDKTFYTIESVEKGLWWVKVRIRGTAGHGSIPHDDNPLVKSARFIERMARHRFPKMISPSVRTFFERTLGDFGPRGGEMARALLSDEEDLDAQQLFEGTPISPHLANAFVRTTCSPTKVQAGLKENVIPDKCEFVLDFRYVPDDSRERIEQTMHSIAREVGVEIETETLQHHPASESPSDHEFYRIIEETVREGIPGGEPVPYMLTGATDSRFMRQIGSVAYGFQPHSTAMDLTQRSRLIHNVDERIDVESLELAVKLLTQVAMRALDVRGG